MVAATTIVTPIWLKKSYKKEEKGEEGEGSGGGN